MGDGFVYCRRYILRYRNVYAGVGFFGICGIILVVAGIVVRMVCGGDVYMLLYMILFALVLFIVMFVVASLLYT